MKQSSFIITSSRIATMRARLGKASEIISDDHYLPFFRNRQINYSKLFKFSVNLARRKNNPEHYLSVIWSKKNLKKTLDWLKKLFAKDESKRAEARENIARITRQKDEQTNMNLEGLARLKALKMQHGLL